MAPGFIIHVLLKQKHKIAIQQYDGIWLSCIFFLKWNGKSEFVIQHNWQFGDVCSSDCHGLLFTAVNDASCLCSMKAGEMDERWRRKCNEEI